MPLITQRNFFNLKQNNSEGFFSFKKRPNTSLYVEYSRTLTPFFEDFKFAYKSTKFYAKWPVRNLGQKHELQYLKKFAA